VTSAQGPGGIVTGTTWNTPVLGARTSPALDGIKPEQMMVADYGRPLSSYYGDRLGSATLSRSITQASTLSLGFIDPKRELIDSPLLNEAVTIDTGANPAMRFKLVQVSKSADKITGTYEDALINYLRTVTGQEATAPGVSSRVDFARQLLRPLGVPINAPTIFTTSALEPLTRGTSQNPDEDTWTCLTRIASDVQYRCFSDGASIWFGPDDWLLENSHFAQIAERAGGVDQIDFDWDVGKPVAQANVTTFSWAWTSPPGSAVEIVNLGPVSGRWLCQDLSRDLYKAQTKATLVAAQPTLPEPTDGNSDSSSFSG
jgi:hypothetical protein